MLTRELGRRSSNVPEAASSTGKSLRWIAGFILASAPLAFLHANHHGIGYWSLAWAAATPAFLLRWAIEASRHKYLDGGFPSALMATLFAERPLARLRDLAPAGRLWILKGFFIPLYGASLLALIGLALQADLSTLLGWLTIVVIYAYTVDLTFALAGYVFASNRAGAPVRSTQSRLFGWLVCLLCYGPIFQLWPAFEAVVRQEIAWPYKIGANATALAASAAMLALLALYVSATVVFGLRFSNLTNRGVITSGPYRYMKHPAYFAHVANAWIITFAFLPARGVQLGLSQLLVPIAFTILYRQRAVTEELHMREEEDYRRYAEWIEQHGLLAKTRNIIMLKWRSAAPI